MAGELPQSITRFQDRDHEFFAWLDSNPDGYFINTERNPKPTYLVLHRPSCTHFTRNPALRWTTDYIKFCSPSRGDLEKWATKAVGGKATTCPTCLG